MVDLNDQIQPCCSGSSTGFVKYCVQVAFGATLMIFAMIMIVWQDGVDTEIYFSLLSGTVGLFLPHPTMEMRRAKSHSHSTTPAAADSPAADTTHGDASTPSPRTTLQ